MCVLGVELKYLCSHSQLTELPPQPTVGDLDTVFGYASLRCKDLKKKNTVLLLQLNLINSKGFFLSVTVYVSIHHIHVCTCGCQRTV